MTQNTEEETTGQVIHMADYLARTRKKKVDEANALIEKAQKLSKNPDPYQDPFASILMKRVDAIRDVVDAMENQIRFIVRGGNASAQIPARGYSLSYGQTPVPPPLNLTFTTTTQ